MRLLLIILWSCSVLVLTTMIIALKVLKVNRNLSDTTFQSSGGAALIGIQPNEFGCPLTLSFQNI